MHPTMNQPPDPPVESARHYLVSLAQVKAAIVLKKMQKRMPKTDSIPYAQVRLQARLQDALFCLAGLREVIVKTAARHNVTPDQHALDMIDKVLNVRL